ncbi:Bug family tripartite tricarboxylate transporter substrate binding protein [Variovorax saccharolyticus]|uniref:Bug family tripartite tricarboxylate transporter substrate binding protein n=1 Tax=Variovorax saccharolyticus TaxID=3053516 RepID=UPI002577FA2A|nr:tripartite tricarboxylate transporter substrate binding protein [Variovorax sp. J31P216]MDM0026492.1 tripartite tricarboxylate transporter substrate binding protein [Variovorax sp. J31P216]
MSTRPHRRALLLQVGAALLATSGWPAARAALGDKPIRLIVPFPAGGGTDVMGRLLAQALSQELGATVIVDNVPGATGTLGSAQAARAAPDGHTLLLGISATHAIAPSLFKDLKYRPDDFTAIARLAHGGNVLVANPGYAANSAPDMVALAKRSRDPLIYGSWGNGSGGHLAMESLRMAAGIETVHVPYKGVAPLLQDVVGGQIQVAMADVAGALPLLRAGRIKALAVTGRKRSSALPEVPTLVEGRIAFDTESWFALFAPARLPADTAKQLAQAADRALRRPELIEKVKSLGMEADPISREAFDKQWHEDIATWARVVQASGAKAD